MDTETTATNVRSSAEISADRALFDSSPAAYWDRMLEAFEREFAQAWAAMTEAGLGGQVLTGTTQVPMTVVGRGWPKGTLAEQIDGISPSRYVLTDDGKFGSARVWHTTDDGPMADGDTVYIEAWEDGWRTFHGYIDPVSRKIVQSG